MLWWVVGIIALLPLFNLLIGVHPPTFKTDDDPGRYGLPYEAVSFPTEDGLTLRGWFIPAAVSVGDSASEPERRPTERRPAIVVGHGYPFDKANILGHTLFLHERYHLLLIDFRYFGESGGAYTTAGLLETRDVAAAVRYLQRRDEVETACLGAMGFSMSAAAFLLARHPGIKAIVADSAYATLEDLIAQQLFFLPGPTKWPLVKLTKLYATLLLGVNVGAAEPAEAVRSLNVPLLLIHGEGDSQIPVDHMRRIAANANPSLTEVWVVPGADHGHAHALTGRHYEARVRQFFDRSLCGRPAPISGHRTFFRAQRTNDQPGECQAVLRRAGFGAVVSDSSGRDTSSVVPEVLQTEILSDGGGRSFGGAIIEVSDRATRASIIRTLDERDGFWQRFRVSRLEGLDEEVAQRQINLSINSEVNHGDPFKAWNKKRVGCEPKEGLNRRAPGGREFDLRWSTADNRAPRENCQASLRTLRAERPRNRWSRA